MKHFADDADINLQLIGVLLTPSWLSGFVSVVTSSGLAIFSVALAHYKGSDTQLQFYNYNAQRSHEISQTIGRVLDSNQLISNLPLLVFWCLVGIVVYLFASNVASAFRQAADLRDQLTHFAHISRRSLVRSAGERFGLRLTILLLWIPYLLFFFNQLVPYLIALALSASFELTTVGGIGYLLFAILIGSVGLHLHVVLLRLLILRPRLSSSDIYV